MGIQNLKRKFIAILLILPLFANAHGEEVLSSFFISFVCIVAFLFVLYFIKESRKNKILIAFSYFLAVGIVYCFTWNIPYHENLQLINWLESLVPAIVALACFFLLRRNKAA
jgi:presenilin-like A22 family membrane protease